MNRRLSIVVPLAALGLGSMASSCSLAPSDGLQSNASTIRYEVPLPDGEPDADAIMPLRIAAKGRLFYAGEPVKSAEVVELFEALGVPNFTKLAIVPADEVSFGDVIAQLSQFSGMGGYELLELETHGEFAKAQTNDGKPVAAPVFVGKLGEYELPVVVVLDAKTSQCVVSFDGMTVGSEELYDRSFRWLDNLVHRAGGVEALLEEDALFDRISVRLQALPTTPWRCIAGAMFNVERSGWPYISLETIKPS